MPTTISGTTGVSQVENNSITTDKIANGTITTEDIANNAINTDKIALGAVISADIANGAVTAAKLDSVGAGAGNPPVYGCRAWVQFSGVTASNGLKDFTNNTARLIRGQGNVSSVIRNNTGDYTITFAIPMPNNAYAVVVGGQGNVTQSNNTVGGIYPRPGTAWGVGSPPPADAYDNHTTNSVRVFTDNGANARFDADLVTVAIFC